MGMIKTNNTIHAAMKDIAKAHRMTVGKLTESVIDAWLHGKVFYLPKTLAQAKAKRG